MTSDLADVLAGIDSWPAPHPRIAVVRPGGETATHGDGSRVSRIASVSKLLTTYAVLVGVTEGAIELDQPVAPPGATVRHLLAHTAGFGFESGAGVIAPPGTRRVYSNRGIEEAAAALGRASGVPFPTYLREAVLDPLGMTSTTAEGSAAFGFTSCVEDLSRFAAELLAPRLLPAQVLTDAVQVAFPGLAGVLPGIGRFDPCDWGLGFERNFGRAGHWSGEALDPRSFGHFGGSGSFLWVDPTRALACVCLTGRDFGPWALQAWPPLCAGVAASAPRHPGTSAVSP